MARLNRRHSGDLIGGAVFLAIKQATAINRTAASSGRNAPRAISVRAVAQSLGFSYETTRRRVIALEAAGMIRRLGESGVCLSPGALDCPKHLQDAAETHASIMSLFGKLKRLGVELPPPPKPSTLEPAELDVAVAGCCDDFALRVIEVGVFPNASSLTGVIFVALVVANADPLTYDFELANRYAGLDEPPPDSVRRAATITEIGQRLGLPHEVVRRRILHLISTGHARRVTGGYMANMEVMQSPLIMNSAMTISQRFLQMTQSLLSLGLDPTAA